MTYNVNDVENAGDSWWVYAALTAGSTEIVIPKALREDTSTPIAGDQYMERNQVILMGFAFNMSTAATSTSIGFTLNAVDSFGTRPIYSYIPSVTAGSTAVVSQSVNCYVKLSPAGADSPYANGAQLNLTISGSPLAGSILLWGLHVPARGRRQFTGSPIAY